MTHAKFHFNQLMLTLIFGIRASEPPPPPSRPGERLKRPGLIRLSCVPTTTSSVPTNTCCMPTDTVVHPGTHTVYLQIKHVLDV